jgi:rfaE bifunctional protein nucleotidyltransferase chain/domain
VLSSFRALLICLICLVILPRRVSRWIKRGDKQVTPMLSSKLLPIETVRSRLQDLRAAGKTIVFTNGCFDLLHVGHVRYLAAARTAGDVLVVGLNSDRSVQAIKGPERPIVPEAQRAEVLAGLECVDYIVLFDDPDPLQVIRTLDPDFLVKGQDWPEDRIVGAEFVKSRGGRVVRIAVVPDASTSAIITRILARYGCGKGAMPGSGSEDM